MIADQSLNTTMISQTENHYKTWTKLTFLTYCDVMPCQGCMQLSYD